MGQVVNNLISNSLKFTSSGGTVKVTAKTEGDNLILAVSDTGAGIPKEKQHLLFTKFTQLAGAAHGAVGTGLGLYIVKGVVEAHGGTVSLESEEGRGTTITCKIPLEGMVAAGATPSPAAPHSSPGIITRPHKIVN